MATDAEPIPCPYCRRKGRDTPMYEVPGSIRCDECNTQLPIDNGDSVQAWLFTAEERLRNPRGVAYQPIPLAGSLDEYGPLLWDAWTCLALYRFNAAIILMGASIEATLQEVLRVHRNEHFHGTMGTLVEYLESTGAVDPDLLEFARRFTSEIRNRWQHQKDAEITHGRGISGKVFKFDSEDGAKGVLDMAEQIKSGEVEMEFLEAAKDPVARMATKNALDEGLAYPLFNQVWMWTMYVGSRYLRSIDYERGREDFDIANPTVVEWKKGKKGTWNRVERAGFQPPDVQRVLRFSITDSVAESQPLGRRFGTP